MVVRKIYIFFYTKKLHHQDDHIFSFNAIKREHNVELEYYYLFYI
jgi:hypothetical protein